VAGTPVVVAAVVGFPHGAQRPEVKALEARLAIADGARELDMVQNVGALRSGDQPAVRDDIAAVVAEARPHGVLVKVILETCFLTPAQIVAACRLAEEAGADFVKTSTGFGAGGATPDAVRTMLDAVGGRLGVKASGGIRSWDDAVRYLDMGCTRLGVGDAAGILDGRPADPGTAY
jgi:deoxyribose-phosphate aldolase